MKKQRTTWLMKHNYPNGYCRAGIVKNTKIGDPKVDVIAWEENYKSKWLERHQVTHMTPEEAIAQANCLLMAVAEWNVNSE
jgi:hypothetical protein